MKKYVISLIGNGFDLAHGIEIKFADFVESEIFKKEMKKYLEYFNKEKYVEFFSGSELWSKFEDYLALISNENEKIIPGHFFNKIGSTFEKWMQVKKSELKFTKDSVTDINIIKIMSSDIIISLNYTNTPKLYGFERKKFTKKSKTDEWILENCIGKNVFIHHFKEATMSGQFILGSDKSNKISKSDLIKNWKGNKGFDIREIVLRQLAREEVRLIKIYGVSFGESDSYLKKFFEKLDVELEIYFYQQKPQITKKRNIKFIDISKSQIPQF